MCRDLFLPGVVSLDTDSLLSCLPARSGCDAGALACLPWVLTVEGLGEADGRVAGDLEVCDIDVLGALAEVEEPVDRVCYEGPLVLVEGPVSSGISARVGSWG